MLLNKNDCPTFCNERWAGQYEREDVQNHDIHNWDTGSEYQYAESEFPELIGTLRLRMAMMCRKSFERNRWSVQLRRGLSSVREVSTLILQ